MKRTQYYERLVRHVVIGGGFAVLIVSNLIAYFFIN